MHLEFSILDHMVYKISCGVFRNFITCNPSPRVKNLEKWLKGGMTLTLRFEIEDQTRR